MYSLPEIPYNTQLKRLMGNYERKIYDTKNLAFDRLKDKECDYIETATTVAHVSTAFPPVSTYKKRSLRTNMTNSPFNFQDLQPSAPILTNFANYNNNGYEVSQSQIKK